MCRWRPKRRAKFVKATARGKQSQQSFRRREDSHIKAIWGEEPTSLNYWDVVWLLRRSQPSSSSLAERSCCRGRFWSSILFFLSFATFIFFFLCFLGIWKRITFMYLPIVVRIRWMLAPDICVGEFYCHFQPSEQESIQLYNSSDIQWKAEKRYHSLWKNVVNLYYGMLFEGRCTIFVLPSSSNLHLYADDATLFWLCHNFSLLSSFPLVFDFTL